MDSEFIAMQIAQNCIMRFVLCDFIKNRFISFFDERKICENLLKMLIRIENIKIIFKFFFF